MTFRKKESKRRIDEAQLQGSPYLALLFISKLTTAVDQNEDREAERENAFSNNQFIYACALDLRTFTIKLAKSPYLILLNCFLRWIYII